MGFVHARTEVTNITGGDAVYSAMFLVDTGSTDTIIPSDELEKLGITRERKRSYELADRSIVEYDVGYAFVQVDDEKVVVNVVFGKDGTEPLLGVTALQSAGLIVDPVHEILRKAAAIPL